MGPTDWDRRWEQRLAKGARDVSPWLVEEACGLPPGRALELACGAGRNAIWLASRGWHVTAVDFSAVALNAARERAAEAGVEVEWLQADVVEWSPPAGTFGLVCVLYLQLPAAERRAVLGHAREALAPGGVLLVVGHDTRNLAAGHGGPSSPEVLFTAEDVCGELDGLTIERAGLARRPIDLEPGGPVALDALVRARRPAEPVVG